VICIVVPTYNEAATLPLLLEGLLALPDEYEVLVVDDDSPDGTAELALKVGLERGRVHVLHRPGKRGYGAASKAGMSWAAERGSRLIATIDGDLTHDPAALPDLVRAIDEGADVAVGSRFAPGGSVASGFPLRRRAITLTANAYARWLVRAPVSDNTSGYRCYRASALQVVDPKTMASDDAFFLIELIAALQDSGQRIVEVPITYAIRAGGTSKISMAHVADAFIRTTSLGLRRRFTRKPDTSR
jgi:glycosyltransferase involved in cell wall biosynthesis